ncbi:MAG: AMP-binding protein, partial [bacterium]
MADTNYNELLEQKAQALEDKTMLLFEDERISYRQMDQRANQVAHGLKKLGAGKGVGVASMLFNSPEALYNHFATQKIGSYTVPINTELKGEHLAYILDHCDARILIIDQSLLSTYEKIRDKAPKIVHVVVNMRDASPVFKLRPYLSAFQDWLYNEPTEQPEERPQNGDIAMLLYTSGTTGPAKGVLYRFGAIGLNNLGLMAKLFYKPDDVLYTCLPLFHANALYVTLPVTMWAEASMALGRRFSASRFWDDIRGYGATTFNALGAMIPILMKQPERPDDADNPVRLVLSAACPASLWEDFEKRFGLKIYEFYGAVDGGGNAVFNLGDCPVGSIGRLPRDKGMVVDENMNEVPPNTPGELVFRVESDKSGVEYYKNEQAAREKVKDGFLHTGDLVYYDEND